MVGRYTHAHQFKRARRQLKFLQTRLGRIIRDVRRKIDGDPVLEARFGPLLGLAQQVRSQDQHQRGPKVYALHDCFSRTAGRQHLSFLTELSGVLGKALFKRLALFEAVTLDDHDLLRSLGEGGSASRSHHR